MFLNLFIRKPSEGALYRSRDLMQCISTKTCMNFHYVIETSKTFRKEQCYIFCGFFCCAIDIIFTLLSCIGKNAKTEFKCRRSGYLHPSETHVGQKCARFNLVECNIFSLLYSVKIVITLILAYNGILFGPLYLFKFIQPCFIHFLKICVYLFLVTRQLRVTALLIPCRT